MLKPAQMPDVKVATFALFGGLDLHSPQSSLKPGIARVAQNFECGINGGYTRIPGYERYDGRPSPSAATANTLRRSAATPAIAVGAALLGLTSGATAVCATTDGDVVVYTKAVGNFVAGETLQAAGVPSGTIAEVGVLVDNQTTLGAYNLAAYMIYRADIGAVPGSGRIRGGFVFNGVNYAWRDNAGATACVLHRSSPTGWAPVALPFEVAFTAGSGTPPAEGATITQGAVSAVVRRVAVRSGTWGAGTAAGRFIIDAPTGGNFAAGALTGGATATLSGAQTQVSFLPGGRFEHDIGNAGRGVRVYGADGVNRGFEFDGTYVVPITTGNTNDAPKHVKAHKLHLFFSFGASVQHSSLGDPYAWQIVTGAGELGTNSVVTGFLRLPGSETSAALAVLMADAMDVLYGTSAADWNKVELSENVGCKPYAGRVLERGYIFDDLGVASISAVQAYGNFATATLTARLRSFVQQRRTLVTDALINREKSQYRAYFSDGWGLYLTIVNGKFIGAMPVVFDHPVSVAWSGESTNGGEVSHFGSTDGYVYRMDVGNSFDGNPITALLSLAYDAQGNSRLVKRYRRAVFEIQGEGYAEFSVGFQLGYGDTDVLAGTMEAATAAGSWDSGVWDKAYWDSRSIAPAQVRLNGSAENISMQVESVSAYWPSFTINTITLHYSPRRLLRR